MKWSGKTQNDPVKLPSDPVKPPKVITETDLKQFSAILENMSFTRWVLPDDDQFWQEFPPYLLNNIAYCKQQKSVCRYLEKCNELYQKSKVA